MDKKSKKLQQLRSTTKNVSSLRRPTIGVGDTAHARVSQSICRHECRQLLHRMKRLSKYSSEYRQFHGEVDLLNKFPFRHENCPQTKLVISLIISRGNHAGCLVRLVFATLQEAILRNSRNPPCSIKALLILTRLFIEQLRGCFEFRRILPKKLLR